MSDNKYYLDIKTKVEGLMTNKEFEEALKIINEELSMPYIPVDFESFLIEKLDQIPMKDGGDSFSLTLEKIVDLLIKLDKSQNDLSELISQLKKFNLKEEKDELEFYFQKSENKRNRAMIFELLINEKADIECDLGNPSKSTSIKEKENYRVDLKNMEDKLEKFPTLVDPAVKLLNEIYLTLHYGQEIEENYSDVVIFTLAKLFGQEELLELIDDYDKLKVNLESFKNFNEI